MPKKAQAEQTPVDDIELAAEHAGRAARKLFNKASHAGEGLDSLTAAIQDEPVKALLIAAGIGVALGLIIRR